MSSFVRHAALQRAAKRLHPTCSTCERSTRSVSDDAAEEATRCVANRRSRSDTLLLRRRGSYKRTDVVSAIKRGPPLQPRVRFPVGNCGIHAPAAHPGNENFPGEKGSSLAPSTKLRTHVRRGGGGGGSADKEVIRCAHAKQWTTDEDEGERRMEGRRNNARQRFFEFITS